MFREKTVGGSLSGEMQNLSLSCVTKVIPGTPVTESRVLDLSLLSCTCECGFTEFRWYHGHDTVRPKLILIQLRAFLLQKRKE